MKLKIGDQVITSEGYIGIVKKSSDLHNVFVQYTSCNGSGLHCLVEGCDEYDPVSLILPSLPSLK